VQGRELANAAVRHFHEQLNAGDYEGILGEADEGFRVGQNHDQLFKLFEAVHKKLGNAGDLNRVNIRVDVNTGGTFITTRYDTTFVNGAATETFVWVRGRGILKRYGYNVQSDAFVVN
jgi:hypothetical protein